MTLYLNRERDCKAITEPLFQKTPLHTHHVPLLLGPCSHRTTTWNVLFQRYLVITLASAGGAYAVPHKQAAACPTNSTRRFQGQRACSGCGAEGRLSGRCIECGLSSRVPRTVGAGAAQSCRALSEKPYRLRGSHKSLDTHTPARVLHLPHRYDAAKENARKSVSRGRRECWRSTVIDGWGHVHMHINSIISRSANSVLPVEGCRTYLGRKHDASKRDAFDLPTVLLPLQLPLVFALFLLYMGTGLSQ